MQIQVFNGYQDAKGRMIGLHAAGCSDMNHLGGRSYLNRRNHDVQRLCSTFETLAEAIEEYTTDVDDAPGWDINDLKIFACAKK